MLLFKQEVVWDGILGLNFANKRLRTEGILPIFDTIMDKKLLTNKHEKNQFAYYLGKDGGAITFGGANMRFKANPDQEFLWAPVTDTSYWTISLIDVRKYDKEPGTPNLRGNLVTSGLCPNGCKAIMDTGTYLVYGPYTKLSKLLKDMTIDSCDKKNTLPNIGFVFKGMQGEFELMLTPDDYVLEFEVEGKKDCVIGLGADGDADEWTFGQVFLRAYYSVFDRDESAIGFVRSNPEPEDFKVRTEEK